MAVPIMFNDIHVRKDFANGVKAGSRLWHVDAYDRKILRVFVYLREVTETDGPFEYIPKPHTRWAVPILRNFGTLPDEMIEQLVSPEQIKACTGPAGTVVFAAASDILHHGKVPSTSDRFTLVFNYNSRNPWRPQEAKPLVSREELVKVAQFLSPYQQTRLLW